MAKYRPHIVFGLVMITYFLIRFIRSRFEDIPHFVRYYLTDLLFVPAMCLFALIILRFLKRNATLTIPWFAVLIQVILVSLYFEWYLPMNPPEGHIHVADLFDCLMYVIGGIGFLILQPHLASPQKNSK